MSALSPHSPRSGTFDISHAASALTGHPCRHSHLLSSPSTQSDRSQTSMRESASQKTQSLQVYKLSCREIQPFSFTSASNLLTANFLFHICTASSTVGGPIHYLYSRYGFLPASKKAPKSSCCYLGWKVMPSQIKEKSSQVFSIVLLINEKVCIYIL